MNMTSLDLRQAFNALSDVVVNRPPPIREFDQIYMKISDMLLQAELLSRWLDGKSVVCVGDGDAIGLTLMHLKAQGIFDRGPEHVHVLDFDERIVNSINSFTKVFQLEENIIAELYNVADPLPGYHIENFEAFYTNPPFGASNGGRSVDAFLRRGDEALGKDGVACIVVADDPTLPWTRLVMKQLQHQLLESGYTISEILPQFHHYHLDDDPELTSCSLIAVRQDADKVISISQPLPPEDLDNFYGAYSPLKVRYVIDLRKGGALPSFDYKLQPF